MIRFHLQSKKRKGFSLVELAVVLALISTVTAVLAFRFFGPWTAATIKSDSEKLIAIDELARREAIDRSELLTLKFDKASRRVTLADSNQVIKTYQWSTNTRLANFRTARFQQLGDPIYISVAPLGVSTSYALELETEGKTKWLLFVGQTGQLFELEQEQEVENYLGTYQ